MATNPIEAESRPVTLPGTFPPMPAVARILARHDRGKLAAFVSVAIDLMDVMDGDTDAEGSNWPEDVRAVAREHLPDDCEAAGDEADTSWTEFHTRGAHKLNPGVAGPDGPLHEDDEDSDADTSIEDDQQGFDGEEDCCLAGDDRVTSGPVMGITEANWNMGPGDADDGEREQMQDDVPMLPVVSAEHNIFTDRRVDLGFSNLMSSFVTGKPIKSADTGEIHLNSAKFQRQPGIPV